MKYLKHGIRDMLCGFQSWAIVQQLAHIESVRKSKRSNIGQWWSTINTAVLIAVLGLIFGSIFELPHDYFLGYLAVGLIVWFHIFAVLIGATTLYPDNRELIFQVALSHAVYPFQLWLKEIIIFKYNLVLIPIVFLLSGISVTPEMIFCLFGLLLLQLNLGWMIVILAIVSVRYRDVKQIVVNVLQLGFYATPIIWDRNLLNFIHADYFLGLNPLFHLIEGVRAPLIEGNVPWVSLGLSLAMAASGWLIALILHGKFHRRIEYWV